MNMKAKILWSVIFFTCVFSLKAQVEISSGGTAMAYTLQIPGVFTLRTGIQITFKANVVCDSAPTINVNSTGAILIKKEGGTTVLSANDIRGGQVVNLAYDGTFWQMLSASGVAVASPNNVWSLKGNTGINPTTNFLGTTDALPLLFRTNNIERVRIDGSGRMGIGTTSPNASSLIDLTDTTKGLLIPRMTVGQRNAIVAPATGLIVYNTGSDKFNYYNGTAWKVIDVISANPDWSTAGNSGTNAATDYIGTSDAVGLVFKTSGNERFRIDATGNVGIGTTTPDVTLHSVGSTNAIFSNNATTTYSGGGKMYPGGWYYATILGGGGAYSNPDGGGMPGGKFIGGNGGTNYGGGGAGVVAIGGNGSINGRSGAGIYAKAGVDGGSANDGVPAVAGYFDGNGTNSILAMAGNVGIGTLTPSNLFSVGTTSQFQVNSTGNIVKINDVITSFPTAQGIVGTILKNDGSGNLSWVDANSLITSGVWTKTGIDIYQTTLTDNVGLGTNAPGAKLDVNPGASFGGIVLEAQNSNSSNANPVIFAINNGTGSGISSNSSGTGNAVYAYTSGGGTTIQAANAATSGNVAYLQTSNSLNTSATLYATSNGTSGYTLVSAATGGGAAGYFSNTSTATTLNVINNAGVGFSAAYFKGRVQIDDGTQANGRVFTSDASGNGSWAAAPATITASNGLTKSVNDIQLGGTLLNNTTITHGNLSLTHNLTGTGNFDIQVSGVSKLFVQNSTGNVGIGKNAPTSALDLVYSGTQGAGIYVNYTNTLTAGANSAISSHAQTSSTGNIFGGYFQTSASSTAAAAWGIYAYATSTAPTNYGLQALAGGVATGGTNIGLQASANSATNNYAIIVPSGGGNVGIGTSAPPSLLTVHSTTSAQGVISTQGTAVNSEVDLNLVTMNNAAGSLAIGNAGTKGWIFGARGDGWSVAGEKNDFFISGFDGATWNQVFNIDMANKYVGIGTTTPAYKLHSAASTALASGNDVVGTLSEISGSGGARVAGLYGWAKGSGAAGKSIGVAGVADYLNTPTDAIGVYAGFSSIVGALPASPGISTALYAYGNGASAAAGLFMNGNVGIGTPPSTTLDVNGALALRTSSVAMAATITPGNFSVINLTGALSSISTINGGTDGKMLFLYHTTNTTLGAAIQNTGNIITLNGAAHSADAAAGFSAILVYNATMVKWIVISFTP